MGGGEGERKQRRNKNPLGSAPRNTLLKKCTPHSSLTTFTSYTNTHNPTDRPNRGLSKGEQEDRKEKKEAHVALNQGTELGSIVEKEEDKGTSPLCHFVESKWQSSSSVLCLCLFELLMSFCPRCCCCCWLFVSRQFLL